MPSAWKIESDESFQPCCTKPVRRVARVLDEAVAVAVAVVVDPVERALDVRPDVSEELAVARAVPILAGEHHEERRRVDAAVVAAERHFAHARHLAVAHLVDDLARLRLLRLVHAVGLRRGEELEHAARDAGVDPQRLECGDDAVAAEWSAEPRHSGVRIRPILRVCDEHAQVGGRASHPLVEPLARRLDRRVLGALGLQRAAPLRLRFLERSLRHAATLAIAADGDRQRDRRFAARDRTRTAPGSPSPRAALHPNRSPSIASRCRGRGSRAGSPCRSERSRAARRASVAACRAPRRCPRSPSRTRTRATRAAPPGCSSRGECARTTCPSRESASERGARDRGESPRPFDRSGCRDSSGRRRTARCLP